VAEQTLAMAKDAMRIGFFGRELGLR